jgi:DNA-binding CsgD family transcriptional regulator
VTTKNNIEEIAVSILNEIDVNIAVIDNEGVIVAVNENWTKFEANRMSDGSYPLNAGEGVNYLKICENAVGDFSDGTLIVYNGIKNVLERKHKKFNFSYPCHSRNKKRWFSMEVKAIRNTKYKQFIVIHKDITEQKIFEMQAQLKEQELSKALSQMQTMMCDMKNFLNSPLSSTTSLAFDGINTQNNSSLNNVDLLKTLSKRELEVFKSLVRGERNNCIAERLGLSEKSISTYRIRIMGKLKVDSNAELATFASRIDFL